MSDSVQNDDITKEYIKKCRLISYVGGVPVLLILAWFVNAGCGFSKCGYYLVNGGIKGAFHALTTTPGLIFMLIFFAWVWGSLYYYVLASRRTGKWIWF